MRYLSVLGGLAALILVTPSSISTIGAAQTGAQEKAANLRAQLAEIETKQAQLQTRLQNLDEKLKPENIEKDLAGIGSTRPEDLREQRRRQLEIERSGVRAQLDVLATSHSRLETAIATADAEAYRQSALPPKGPAVDAATTEESTQAIKPERRPRRVRKRRTRKPRRMHHSQGHQTILQTSRSSPDDDGRRVVPFATRGW
jgi:chromosome segregation ATPase